MKNLSYYFLGIMVLFGNYGFGQYNQEKLFPDLEGEELLEAIVENYKAQIIFMDYGDSRDTLFSKVYMQNDSLKCVYSGHTLYLNPNSDPTTFVYMNGSDNGINTEHTYPRSKGAEFGNPRSDMHHLFPTRSKVNEERSNFPFGDIDDNETDVWFYKNQSTFNKPTQNIDKYSEWKWMVFEPREDHKGNVARAIFYFYTMYKDLADAEDPEFFWNMVPTLCEWHFQDPVDSLEWTRTQIIAQYQQFPNPFILDCSLVSRTYCEMTNDACELAVPVNDFMITNESEWNITYDKIKEEILINSSLTIDGPAQIQVFNTSGQLVKTYRPMDLAENDILSLPFFQTQGQIFLVHINFTLEGTRRSITKKLVIF